MDSPVTWLVVAVLVQSGAILSQAILFQKMNRMWTRSFLDKQGIPLHIMDDEPEPKPVVKSAPPAKTKVSIPVPGWRPGLR